MRTPKERYLSDPVYHMVVEQMRALITSARLSASEIREAAMLACIIEEEYRPAAPFSTSDEELDIVRHRFKDNT